MKAKPKNKVQAQRKFAQGAIVPPSTRGAVRRRNVAAKEDPVYPLGQNTIVKLPARSLLDMVAFKNVHNHLQPFVLLKRLPEPPTENGNTPAVKEKSSDNDNCYAVEKDSLVVRPKRVAALKARALHTMSLRSCRRQPTKKQTPAPKRKKVSNPVPPRPKRRRVMLPSLSEFSGDDYKPLTYFSKRRNVTPFTRSKRRLPMPGPSTANDDIQKEFSGHESEPEPDFDPDFEPVPSCSTSVSEQLLAAISIAIDTRVILYSELVDFSKGLPNELNKKLSANKLSPIDKSQALGLLQRLDVPYYSSSQVARWVDTCTHNGGRSRNSSELFKAPYPPTAAARRIELPSVEIMSKCEFDVVSICSTSTNPECPAEKYNTFKDVLLAPQEELENRCNKCKQCSVVDKVPDLIDLAVKPIKGVMDLRDDVYEFKVSSTEHTKYYVRRFSDPETFLMSQANIGNNFCLDILPEECSHFYLVIDINGSFFSASIVPKSHAPDCSKLLLVDHEYLIDQLMFTMRATKFDAEMLKQLMRTDVTTSSPMMIPTPRVVIEPTPSLVQRRVTPRAAAKHHQSTAKKKSANTDEDKPPNLAMQGDNLYKIRSAVPGVHDSREWDSKLIQADATIEVDSMTNRIMFVSDPYAKCHIESVLSVQEQDIPDSPEPPVERGTRRSGASKAKRKSLPKSLKKSKMTDAPVFYPTNSEFRNPITYFEKIMPTASKYGLCKIVAPKDFKPKSNMDWDIQFSVTNQYVARMFSRWGPAQREMSAIKAYLSSQNVSFVKAPLLDCLEVDLPKLYHTVQKHGGLNNVNEKKRWPRVAYALRNKSTISSGKRLDFIYIRFVLPYGTLSIPERQDMMRKVESGWIRRDQRLKERARNPLHRQKKLLGESDSSNEDDDDEDEHMNNALFESEDCVMQGRHMNLAMFKRAGGNVKTIYFPPPMKPTIDEIENCFWKIVVMGTDHLCVNAASIDTGSGGYGFPKSSNDQYYDHPWNLKMLMQNSGNVLASLGPLLGVTVPTLHLGMMFSASCWHRDPHGLPWIEYMHHGAEKIWYGVPDEQSDKFRQAVEKLCPSSCQNKSIWLPSDIAMIPPALLSEHNVTLTRVIQKPGEYIIVFPKAYACNMSTGYTQSESVYFATNAWLDTVHHTFQEVRRSCEPTMFSVEQLLVKLSKNDSLSVSVLQKVHSHLSPIVMEEFDNRRALALKGFKFSHIENRKKRPKLRPSPGAWNVREEDECEICRTTFYFSKVSNMTGTNTCVCLRHALLLSQLPKYHKADFSKYDVVILLPDTELLSILSYVQNKLA